MTVALTLKIWSILRFNGTIPRNVSDWTSLKSTNYVHDGIKMTEYENEPFVVGNYDHTEVEFFHMSYEKWFSASPYQTSISKPRRIFGYSPVSRPGKVFILGGCCDGDWAQISLFQNDEWSLHGLLKQGRMNFMTITYGTDVMIIGGKTYDNQP